MHKPAISENSAGNDHEPVGPKVPQEGWLCRGIDVGHGARSRFVLGWKRGDETQTTLTITAGIVIHATDKFHEDGVFDRVFKLA